VTTSRVEIDLAAIDRNVSALRRCAREGAAKAGVPESSVQFCGVVKQDAYGLGAVRVAKRLASIGVDLLAVYCAAEARILAEAPINTPVLILMPTYTFDRNDPLYRLAVRDRLHFALHSIAQAEELHALANKLGMTLPVHVQLDVGMSRGGCLPEEATALVRFVVGAPRLRLAGVMTHFSSPSSDEVFTKEQAKLFRHWIEGVKPLMAESAKKGHGPCVVHAANTAATLRSHNLHGTMLRVGQGMYGYGGENWFENDPPEFAASAEKLEPAVRWLSRIVHVQDVPAGWPVGYDRTFVTSRPSRIAIVPVGYADGYPRALSNRGVLRLTGLEWDRPRTIGPLEERPDPGVAGKYARVVGRVSMDQITLDVTDCPAELCRVGMEVEVIGTDKEGPNHLPLIATLSNSITHELLCRISPHLERVYVASNDRPVEEGIEPLAKVVPGGGVSGRRVASGA
jgi:alanine racemase